MGTVFSGTRGYRGGRDTTSDLPEVRLTNAELYKWDRGSGPYVRPEFADMGMVVWGAREWPVLFKTHDLHLGGQRRWLCCPQCESRRVALYIAKGNLVCRECLGLRYASQNDNRRALLISKGNKIRRRLGWPPGVLNPDGKRPARMHRSTYARLCGELEEILVVLLPDLNDFVTRFSVAVDERRNRIN